MDLTQHQTHMLMRACNATTMEESLRNIVNMHQDNIRQLRDMYQSGEIGGMGDNLLAACSILWS